MKNKIINVFKRVRMLNNRTNLNQKIQIKKRKIINKEAIKK